MQDKKKDKDYNLNVFFRHQNIIDMTCYKILSEIREQHGFSTKQAIEALALFYESFRNPDMLKKFPLFNMGGFITHLKDNPNIHEDVKAVLSETDEISEQSVKEKENVLNNDKSSEREENNTVSETENIEVEADSDIDDAAIASYLMNNNMMFNSDD